MVTVNDLNKVPEGSTDPANPRIWEDNPNQSQGLRSKMMAVLRAIVPPATVEIAGWRGTLAAHNLGEPADSAGSQASGTKGSSKTTVGSGNKREALKILERKLGKGELKGVDYKDIPRDVAKQFLKGEISADEALCRIRRSIRKKEKTKESAKGDDVTEAKDPTNRVRYNPSLS